MSADQETNHDMTQHDIAVRLADAADEVEIGIAPTQALIRGGRRRRSRRWAITAAAALVVAGSAGALAVTALPGGDSNRVARPALRGSGTTDPGVLAPHRTVFGSGTEQGQEWEVSIDVWTAPADEGEAAAQLKAMDENGEQVPSTAVAHNLVGNTSYFIHKKYGSNSEQEWGSGPRGKPLPGNDFEFAVGPLPGTDGPRRLVIGHVAKTAEQVTCVWKDGTKTELLREPENRATSTGKPAIRSAEGTAYNWFACLAPQGTESDGVAKKG
ncbi:hypothetical protein [Streptomyces sp. LUP30]|uniref:hypothetical protein n=1 Tax=Streptomyces sp. LUP30 TaxID=1890285 RepID=UPI000A52BDC3|nr:hypothetical protein [Streptomyces sp. LUP30]